MTNLPKIVSLVDNALDEKITLIGLSNLQTVQYTVGQSVVHLLAMLCSPSVYSDSTMKFTLREEDLRRSSGYTVHRLA